MPNDLLALVDDVLPLVVDLRRSLHRIPERGHEEYRTTELIASTLGSKGVIPTRRQNGTGLWVDVGGSPVVGFRADIDALPIDEPEDNDPRSENPGWMHACGHDAHAAVGVGIALILANLDLPGGVRFLFQPAEERLPGGARLMVEEGLVNGLKSIIAFHVNPVLPAGQVGVKEGPITASTDGMTIVIEGPGGHTSRPQNTVDLVAAAARVVADIPQLIREAINPSIPVVTAFGSIHGGDAPNVIPARIELKGTVRTGDRKIWGELAGIVDSALAGVLRSTGASYHLDYVQGVAPVVNDPGVVATASGGMARVLGPESVVPVEMSMGGEDFYAYLDEIPGALLRLGSHSGGGDIHSSTFKINEDCLRVGVIAGAAALLELLDES